MLTYTPAQAGDIERIFQLNKQLIDKFEDLDSIEYDKVLAWVRRNIERNIASFTRIFYDGKLAGYYCLTPADGKKELDSLFVLTEFQNRGIGTEILRKCLADSTALFLYVFRRNVGAVTLYRRMGFSITKEVGKTRYIMEYQNQGC